MRRLFSFRAAKLLVSSFKFQVSGQRSCGFQGSSSRVQGSGFKFQGSGAAGFKFQVLQPSDGTVFDGGYELGDSFAEREAIVVEPSGGFFIDEADV